MRIYINKKISWIKQSLSVYFLFASCSLNNCALWTNQIRNWQTCWSMKSESHHDLAQQIQKWLIFWTTLCKEHSALNQKVQNIRDQNVLYLFHSRNSFKTSPTLRPRGKDKSGPPLRSRHEGWRMCCIRYMQVFPFLCFFWHKVQISTTTN